MRGVGREQQICVHRVVRDQPRTNVKIVRAVIYYAAFAFCSHIGATHCTVQRYVDTVQR
jgi:hypothetical protein